MEIGKTLYVTHRADWRLWLEENHQSEPDIWLIYYKKDSGKPFIPYDDAVEEALCFGWIDSIVKKYDAEARAQRFSPRKPKSELSELNKERIRRMIAAGKMTDAGIQRIEKHLVKNKDGSVELKPFVIPGDIIARLKENTVVWKNYTNFPDYYKNIRIGFIETARERPDIFEQRLMYFINMTAKNKRFGSMK